MDVSVMLLSDRAVDDALELRSWLVEEDRLRGRVQLVSAVPETGSLGGLADTIMVNLSSGAVGIFATALITWLRHRAGTARVTVQRPDGTHVEIDAKHVHGLDAEALRALVEQLALSLRDDEDPHDGTRSIRT